MSAPDDRDPLTGEPGSHPVSTGAGAVTGGMIGAAVGGLIGGPLGVMVGVGVGSVAGGLGGKAMAEVIDFTEDENHWRREHSNQTYAEGLATRTTTMPIGSATPERGAMAKRRSTRMWRQI